MDIAKSREKLFLASVYKRCQKYYGRYPAIDEYILSGYIGSQMWNDSYVYLWIKYNADKAYDIAKGIFYSVPCTCKDGQYTVVNTYKVNDAVKALMKASEKELLEEKAEAGIKG